MTSRVPQPARSDGYLAVRMDVKDEAHERICKRVRLLLETGVTQRELARLFGCDPSSINRALLPCGDPRQREWMAWEIYALAEYYNVPPARFFAP